MLDTEQSCREYLANQTVSTIACQIRRDQESCKAQRLPSILAKYLPAAASESADQLALELCPETAVYGKSITRAQYTGIVHGIKSYLDQMSHASRLERLPATDMEEYSPSNEEIETTLRVLDFCLKSEEIKGINLKTSLDDIFQALSVKTQDNNSSEQSKKPSHVPHTPKKLQKKCYICQFDLVVHHPLYPSLCKQCGDFNLASCSISLPANLTLKDKTALITGGRLNLGFHTALRLLRCGAKVIVTTRYPQDAEVRYIAEPDFDTWQGSLRIIGADFRAAKDVFQLVVCVKEQLAIWSNDGISILDILINNAAQTLTDPLDTERKAVQREHQLRLEGQKSTEALLLASSSYRPRIRGDLQGSLTSKTDQQEMARIAIPILQSASPQAEDTNLIKYLEETKSSWMQFIDQIPYEDIISAHSVNTFVPLILLRELLPLMGAVWSSTLPRPSRIKKSKKPLGYVINVSSREGIFESSPASSSKHGHHVHTNLTKAALNMLTETEAGPAWKSRRVAINTVDPGYMSAAPEIEELWKKNGRVGCPISWEDGAGRVLWPIAVGERGEGLIWGRFLKHFGSTEVDVGVGR